MCNHIFYPEEWNRERRTEAIPDRPIKCKVPSLDESSYCKYHINNSELQSYGKTEDEVFLELLDERRKVLGAHFQSVSLGSELQDGLDSDNVGIRNVRVDKLQIKDTVVEADILIEGSEFEIYNESDTKLHGKRIFSDVHFSGKITYSPDRAFDITKFTNCQFSPELHIHGDYHDQFTLAECDINREAEISDATFHESVRIGCNSFRGNLFFTNVKVDGTLELEDNQLPLITGISDSNIDSIRTNPTSGLPSLIDIRSGTTLQNGSLGLVGDRSVYYDLGHCTIGNVSLDLVRGTLDQYTFHGTDYDGFEFINISDQLEEEDFNIHQFGYSRKLFTECPIQTESPHIIRDILPQESYSENLELRNQVETYTRAKNCAKVNGSGRLASRFFIKQKLAEKEKYKKQLEDAQEQPFFASKRSKYRLKYAKNWGFRWLCKYGEDPWYPIYWSIGVVGVSSLFYPYWGLTSQDGSLHQLSPCLLECNISVESIGLWLDSLYFSAVVFTSLGSGSLSPGSVWARLLSGVEAFLGAVLVALFVFTLSRQINR